MKPRCCDPQSAHVEPYTRSLQNIGLTSTFDVTQVTHFIFSRLMKQRTTARYVDRANLRLFNNIYNNLMVLRVNFRTFPQGIYKQEQTRANTMNYVQQ